MTSLEVTLSIILFISLELYYFELTFFGVSVIIKRQFYQKVEKKRVDRIGMVLRYLDAVYLVHHIL